MTHKALYSDIIIPANVYSSQILFVLRMFCFWMGLTLVFLFKYKSLSLSCYLWNLFYLCGLHWRIWSHFKKENFELSLISKLEFLNSLLINLYCFSFFLIFESWLLEDIGKRHKSFFMLKSWEIMCGKLYLLIKVFPKFSKEKLLHYIYFKVDTAVSCSQSCQTHIY